jgi:phosphoribosylformylglycinamidine synthase
MKIYHMYRRPVLTGQEEASLKARFPSLERLESEYCYNVGVDGLVGESEQEILRWLLAETFEPENFSLSSFLKADPGRQEDILELGPRLSFQTAWSTNAVSVFHSAGFNNIVRIERSRRYAVAGLSDSEREHFASIMHDRMTECVYEAPLTSFDPGVEPEAVLTVPVLKEGRAAIEEINKKMGLGFDEWDIDYYLNLFTNIMKKNPTNVELFDLGQSNSEHSRHWFFKGRLVIDGKEMPKHLFEIVSEPYNKNPRNSIIAFKDNSSSIKGNVINTIIPEEPGKPTAFKSREVDYDIIFTAETHNFPSGVAPFPGAETGTGGRIRDVQGVGRGGLVVAGTAAYCVGNLQIPGYILPWESQRNEFSYPENLASPLEIEIEASNGASDYGNKFGEPLIQGFTRSFGLRLPNGERREWIKPIMFTGGIGQMDVLHRDKFPPKKGMILTKVGGPAYRIGMGGGAASSMVQGENVAELDFNAVQRGDAEMEQKMNRVIRACVELGDKNPVISMHDQGAGGNCNVLKELVEPEGARIDIRKVVVGDATLSVLEIWGAEYQENDALLLDPDNLSIFEELCKREKVLYSFVGEVTGDGRVVVFDSNDNSTPVDLELKHVLAEMPQKVFDIKRSETVLEPIRLPHALDVRTALDRVLKLVSVGSKRFLTNKVDRSVSGLIARQQCCGPLGLTVSDVAVIAQSHFGVTGAASSIGEQPIKGLVNAAAMARMSVAEALTNIVWAALTHIEDIRCSANWMWAAKLPGEGAHIYDAAVAMSQFMSDIGIAIDGGKDSLSMASLDPETGEMVKAPGALVISAYCTTPDITKTVTPDIKRPGKSRIIYLNLGGPDGDKARLGGSALGQVMGQIGDVVPDIEDPAAFKSALESVQALIKDGVILSGHDVSDGGLVVTLLEMAFSGNCGFEVDIPSKADVLPTLFAEEAGLVFEVANEDVGQVESAMKSAGVKYAEIGSTKTEKQVRIKVNGADALDEQMEELRSVWEETSYQLERLQVSTECAESERNVSKSRRGPVYKASFEPMPVVTEIKGDYVPPKVAIVREEGSNGDREMASAFYAAGFEPWDVTMTDLMRGSIGLGGFRGVVFVGGFSYADVLDSAKGWAGAIRFNERLSNEFEAFYNREDTFSLGVCNGCQLSALLGWVPWRGIKDEKQPRFIHNASGRFESRFSTVKISKSPSIMLKGMEGSELGVWVAHGEGKFHAPDPAVLDDMIAKGLVPLRYVDDEGKETETYPYNPNGSPGGITGVCSPDGRHLAMMPHPERAFLKWQWPWLPEELKNEWEASPWLRMFENARVWCEGK